MTFYTSMYLCIFESFSSDSFIWRFRQVMKKTHWWCLSNKNNFPNQICSMPFMAKPWGKATDAIEFVLKSHNLSGGFPLTSDNLFISLEVEEESKREIVPLHILRLRILNLNIFPEKCSMCILLWFFLTNEWYLYSLISTIRTLSNIIETK